MLLMESQCGHLAFLGISRQGNGCMNGETVYEYMFYRYRVVRSFEAIAENLVDLNRNFTNITLLRTNLAFQGTRVSSALDNCL